MFLTFEKIQTYTSGALWLSHEDGIVFHRFSQAREAVYRKYHPALAHKTRTTAGISIEMETDALALNLDAEVFSVLTRSYFSFDLFINGSYYASISNCGSEPQDVEFPYPMGRVQKRFPLPAGNKIVRLLFPWSVEVHLHCLSLEGATYLLPVKKERRVLFLGDSITHGYDAFPSFRSYASQLTSMLNAEAVNNAISAECFFPELVQETDTFLPDIIFVAYGTNDWEMRPVEEFEQNCKAFFHNLTSSYPHSKIFAITPIWRKDQDAVLNACPFSYIQKQIQECARPYPNVTVLVGYDLVPHDEACFGDYCLHPNAKGFNHYASRVYQTIQPYL